MKLTKACIFVLLYLTVSKCLPAQQINDSIFHPGRLQTFRLIDAAQKKSTILKNYSFTEPLILFVFLSPECPLCKNYMPVLNALQLQYRQTVKMTGIIPGRCYHSATVTAFAKKYKTGFPLLIDPVKKLTNYLHASVTPEVVLLNNNYELVYKGAIDNSVKQLGIKRWQATENYLAYAITQYLQHNSIAVKRIKATGCLINDF
jgi:thiol-disulfide isomerase/thioredoxin